MKLLAPAGNFESLKTAVINGADEVYLGINDFNARNNVQGFSIENLKTAVDYAHVYGVKVLLALNILFSDQEMPKAVQTAVTAFNLGVDAFIVQDLGLATILKRDYPKMQLHASTQMGVHNLEGVLQLEKIGFSRVVLARETPLDEIERISKNSNIEIEYFVHGALCVSFSGNCYLSSYLNDASGNRGRCKQLCRLTYSLKKGEKTVKKGYLLSAKDFNMSNRLKDLKKAGVNVLKIEGRARRPYYVGTVVKEYLKALNGEKVNQDNLKLAFNRNFTEGYFNGNGKIISNIQNHIGVKIGVVESVSRLKTFNRIIIKSDREIPKKSTLKIFSNGVEKSVLSAFDVKPSGDKYAVTTTQNLSKGDIVYMINDARAEAQLSLATRKRNVQISLEFIVGKLMKAQTVVNGKKLTIFGEECSPSKTRPLSEGEIISNFNKSEYFNCELKIKLEKVFIAKQKLNEFRRNVYQKIFDCLTEVKEKLKYIEPFTIKNHREITDYQVVEDISEPYVCERVIYSPEIYDTEEILKFKNECIKQGRKPYLDTPNFALSKDVKLLKEIIEKTKISIVVNNIYALSIQTKKIIGANMNVYNAYTENYLGTDYIRAEKVTDGKLPAPYMTLRHCPIKAHVGGDCNRCLYQDGYYYQMDGGRGLKLKRKKLSTCTFYLVD